MKKIVVSFLFLAVFCQNLNLFADDEEDKLRLAVMEFEDKSGKLSEETLSNATEYIRGAFVSSNKFIVIAKERQENAMIKQMKKDSYKLCNDKNCQIPLGQALSADTILRTTITFLGETYTITAELIDLAKEATTKGAQSSFDGSEKSLIAALDEIVAQIVGRKGSGFQQGRFGGKQDNWEIGSGSETIVNFESSPDGASVIVDGKMLCQTPCSKMLTQGNHEIEMQKVNYVPKIKRGKIKKGSTIKYTLDPDFAWLSVRGNYEVDLKLDGQNIGRIPVEKKVISAGNHLVEHTNRCFYDLGETFTVKRGEKKNITFNLEHRESAIQVYAKDEKGNDIDADVFVDDKKAGTAPGTFKVPLCSKKLIVKKGNFEYSEELSLKEKNVKTINALLERKGLQWSKDAPKRLEFSDAKSYCKDLKEKDYDDWRLPNIDELRTLITNCPNTQIGGACKVSEKDDCFGGDCESECWCSNRYSRYSRYDRDDKDAVIYWSSSTYYPSSLGLTIVMATLMPLVGGIYIWMYAMDKVAYTVDLSTGNIGTHQDTQLDVICVRGSMID